MHSDIILEFRATHLTQLLHELLPLLTRLMGYVHSFHRYKTNIQMRKLTHPNHQWNGSVNRVFAPIAPRHFVAGSRAHGRGGLRGVRTAKEKAGLLEGKLEDLVALKSAGRLVP